MKIRKWAAILLPCALFFAYPLGLGKIFSGVVPFWSEVPLFGPESLGWLAAAVCAAVPGRLARGWREDRAIRVWLIFSGIAAGLLLLQWTGPDGGFGQFSIGLFYLALPLAGFCCARELFKALPVFLGVVGAVAAAVVLRESFSTSAPVVGMTGNWNWSATLLAVSLPFLAFRLPVRFRTGALIVLLAAALLWPLVQFYPYYSRGTLAAAAAAGGLLAGCRLAVRTGRFGRTLAGCGFLIAAVAAAALFLWLPVSGQGSPEFRSESRVQLWRGTAALAAARPLAGWGPARFETEIPRFLPPEYFESNFATDRHPHPHNEWLFYLCGFGLSGGALFLMLVWLLMRGLLRIRRREPELLLLGWGTLLLLLHGQLDVLLGTPLAGGLFLLSAGAFAAKGGRVASVSGTGAASRRFRYGVAVFLVFCALAVSIRGAVAGWYLREGKLAGRAGRFDVSASALERSIGWLAGPENLVYLAQVELFNRRNPDRAEILLRRLPETGFSVYGHSFRTLGQALAVQGKYPEALAALEQEERLFPASALAAGLKAMVFERQGRPAPAGEEWRVCRERMLRKGLDPRIWPVLLDFPELDDSPVARQKWRRGGADEFR